MSSPLDTGTVSDQQADNSNNSDSDDSDDSDDSSSDNSTSFDASLGLVNTAPVSTVQGIDDPITSGGDGGGIE